MQTFYVSSFVFLILYSAQAYSAIRKRRNNGKIWRVFNTDYRLNLFNVLYFLAWIIPLSFSIPLYTIMFLSDENSGNLSNCFTCLPILHFNSPKNCENYSSAVFHRSNKLRYGFLSSQIGTLILLILFLSLSLIEYHKYLPKDGVIGYNDQKNWNKRKQQVCYFLFSFTFCWICSIGMNIFVLVSPEDIYILYPFYLTEALTNPLHGFLNSIIYGWHRKSFTSILKTKSYNNKSTLSYESVSSNDHIRPNSSEVNTFENSQNSEYLSNSESKLEKPNNNNL